MEDKKNRRFDLEGKRVIFFEIGLIISLLVAIGLFRHSSLRPGPPPSIDEWSGPRSAEITYQLPEVRPPEPEVAAKPVRDAGSGSVNVVRQKLEVPDAAPVGGGLDFGDVGADLGTGSGDGTGSGTLSGKQGDGEIITILGRVYDNKDRLVAIVHFRITRDKEAEFERNRRKILRRLESGKYPGGTPESPVTIIKEVNDF